MTESKTDIHLPRGPRNLARIQIEGKGPSPFLHFALLPASNEAVTAAAEEARTSRSVRIHTVLAEALEGSTARPKELPKNVNLRWSPEGVQQVTDYTVAFQPPIGHHPRDPRTRPDQGDPVMAEERFDFYPEPAVGLQLIQQSVSPDPFLSGY